MPGDDKTADAARQAVNQASSGELVSTGAGSLHELVDLQASQIGRALPANMDAERYVRTVHTLLLDTPKLLACSKASFFGAVYNAAALGLEFPMGQAYVLPYGRQAKLIIGYKGWTALAYRTGEVQSITPRTVFEKDIKFKVKFGVDDDIEHEPLLSDDKGKPTHYYVVVRTVNGGRNFVVMSKSEVDHHRDRYGGKSNGKIVGPWADKDQYEPMAWKTCFLRMKAWLPTSVELMQAERVDNKVILQESAEEEPKVQNYSEDEDVVDAEIVGEGDDADKKWVAVASGGNSGS